MPPPPAPGPLPIASGNVSQDEAQYTAACSQHAQLIKAALQYDVTRVISYSYAAARSALRFINILPPGAIIDTSGYQNISHNGGTDYLQAQIAIETFYAETTARLLLDMKNTPDVGGGSLLDNTLVVYWNNFSEGNPSGTDDMPVLLFGGKFWNLQGGKYLQFGKNARTMADVWVAGAGLGISRAHDLWRCHVEPRANDRSLRRVTQLRSRCHDVGPCF